MSDDAAKDFHEFFEAYIKICQIGRVYVTKDKKVPITDEMSLDEILKVVKAWYSITYYA